MFPLPLLFNIFIIEVVEFLRGEHYFPVKIGNQKYSSLLYANGAILVSYAQMGLHRLELVQFVLQE